MRWSRGCDPARDWPCSLFNLTETTSISLAGLTHALGILGVEPIEAIDQTARAGLAGDRARAPSSARSTTFEAVLDRATSLPSGCGFTRRCSHGVRTAPPESACQPSSGRSGQVRESDGLEPILRLGALWQRVGAEPLRQTHQGTLYKRDRDRLDRRPGPYLSGRRCTQATCPLTRSSGWRSALRRGADRDGPGGRTAGRRLGRFLDRQRGSPAANDRHRLAGPAVLARAGSRVARMRSTAAPALPFLRFALVALAVVRLANRSGLPSTTWRSCSPRGGRPGTGYRSRTQPADRPGSPPRGTSCRPRQRPGRGPSAPRRALRVLETILLGAAYPLGLVRAAEEGGTRTALVQLTDQGRYVLAMGPTPPPRPTFEQFIFVQPNFEVIAYRQGLTPPLVGRLSRFAWWSQIGAALELKLTRESIVLGLDWGLTAETILEILTKHSQRPLPPGVTDAVKNWANRRETCDLLRSRHIDRVWLTRRS